MDESDLIERLEAGKVSFLSMHKYLLQVDANERSITHKFAECLRPLFQGWDIDCEYNRDGYSPKKIGLNEDEMIPVGDENAHTVFPDIIIHHRGKNGKEHNLAIIEAKKDSSDRSRLGDLEKIERIKRGYDYQFGVFLNFVTGDIPELDYLLV